MKNIVLFASGSGSNVENIVQYFESNTEVTITAVLSNNKDAKVLERCNKLNISALYFNKTSFYEKGLVRKILRTLSPDLIVLAGFLWKMPQDLIQDFPDRIINIHPALLPKYGGKGMYGNHVHQAVKDNMETETGITIHFVNENYDEGAIIYQATTNISPENTIQAIANKVQALEYEYFPRIIEKLLNEG
ncbi:phosphoribosylglycinamide formyltransferase [Ulvibacterium sp.]|uniref:phosphoribosylglycinamide formyltransferase n=1 Tax=Ulvibacterium sp. TaxID=2665914 RepID=UPI003CC61D1F